MRGEARTLPRKPDCSVSGLQRHGHEEMTYLAGFLPGLDRENVQAGARDT